MMAAMNGIVLFAATDSPFLAVRGGGDLAVLLVPLAVILAIVSIFWHFRRSRAILESWAAENGLEILESDYRWFSKGPFFWTSSREQTVFYVKVRDQDGTVRTGWVRCGGWFVGLWSNRADVRWEG